MAAPGSARPPSTTLAIIVVVFNMRREAPRTLHSLSAGYQLGVSPDDYEVICIENGSTDPLSPDEVQRVGPNFRYVRIEDASPSPAAAMNLGVARSHAPYVGLMIDGARIASPGVVALALKTLQAFEPAVVATIGFHLGPDRQYRSQANGYTRRVEDRLLAHLDWRHHGYRMFGHSSLSDSSSNGWFGPISESNLLFLPRRLFDDLHGYDERFDLPGGGFVNLDFYRRACDVESATLITLLGEATFHQLHGGVASNQPETALPELLKTYQNQYVRIRGVRLEASTRPPLLVGSVGPDALGAVTGSCDEVLRNATLWRRGQRAMRRLIGRVLL